MLDHPGSRLATAALLPVALDLRLREVRTVVITVDAGTGTFEPPVDLAVHGVDERFIDDPTSNGRLVRDHDRRKSRSLQQSQRIDGPGEQRQPVQSIEVTTLLDDRAVAIEKYGGALMTRDPGFGIRDPGFAVRDLESRSSPESR